MNKHKAFATLLVLLASNASADQLKGRSVYDLTLKELLETRIISLATGSEIPLAKAPSVASVITADDINKMGFLDNPQYPGGFMPKGKTTMVSHTQSTFLYFEQVMDGTTLDGVRDGACWRFAWLCFVFRIVCSTQPVLPDNLLFGHVFDI